MTNIVSEAHYKLVNSIFTTGFEIGPNRLRTPVRVVFRYVCGANYRTLVLTKLLRFQ